MATFKIKTQGMFDAPWNFNEEDLGLNTPTVWNILKYLSYIMDAINWHKKVCKIHVAAVPADGVFYTDAFTAQTDSVAEFYINVPDATDH